MSPNGGFLEDLAFVESLARELSETASGLGLPYIAASADISSTAPMTGADGRPLASSVFRWVDPDLRYWSDPGFALRAPFVMAARYSAEPFYFDGERFATWRRAPALEAIEVAESARAHNVARAIILPAYLTGGVIGCVVLATDKAVDVRGIFEARAAALHAQALRMMAAYQDASTPHLGCAPVRLTRREIQCLKWAAAGKTDAVIGEIVQISTPTVRFHLKNAAEKLQVSGRSQAIFRAAALGYIGPARPQA